MAMLFDTDTALGAGASDAARAQRVLDDARADHGLTTVLDHAKSIGGRAGLQLLATYRGRIAATETQILADFVQDDGDTRRAERLLNDGRTSKREQRKKANRAKAVGQNADLATKLGSGDLSEEQLDVIADASAKSDGDAACDDDLIDKVASVRPEQGRNIVDDYLADRATKDGVQTEHRRQRTLRRAHKYHNKNKGLDAISLEGDGVSSTLAWDQIQKRANAIYERDGGRELPKSRHPRTHEQRLHDAVIELLTGQLTTPNGHTKPDPTNASAMPSRSSRPNIVVGITIDHALGQDPGAIATQIGLGLIPDSVLAGYAANAEFIAAIYNRNGEPLWLARLDRYATHTQMLALILRDRGCVLCGADHTRCQAHHTMPWGAPAKGRTDLDNLVLLCEPCHQRLHSDGQTIYQDTTNTWRTRPATPDELPAPRPNSSRNQVRRE